MLSVHSSGNIEASGRGPGAVERYYEDSTKADRVEVFGRRDAPTEGVGHGVYLAVGLAAPRHLDGTPVPLGMLKQMAGGVAPDGRAVQNAGDADRQMGLDLVYSAPKSVSVVWEDAVARGDRETARRIEAAHIDAVRASVDYIGGELRTRRGHAGEGVESAGALAVRFDQFQSRAGDPQIHSHVVLPNISYREDRSVGTLLTHDVFLAQKAAGGVYQTQLAYNLSRNPNFDLGYDVVPGDTPGTFKIAGVDPRLESLFSKRSEAIEKAIGPDTAASAARREAVAVATRGPHNMSPEPASTAARWMHERESAGLAAVVMPDWARAQDAPSMIERVQEGAGTATETDAAPSRHKIIAAVVSYAVADGRPARGLLEAVREAEGTDLVPLRDGATYGQSLFTTPDMLKTEAQMLADVNALAGRDGYAVHLPEIALAGFDDDHRKVIQAAAGGGAIAVLEGPPGAAKTASIKIVVQAYREAGYNVIVLAPTAKAVEHAAEVTGVKHRETIDSFVLNPEVGPKTLIVVDEAGMAATRQTAAVTAAALAGHAKLVLVGDDRQLPPVGAGAPFHVVRDTVREVRPDAAAELTYIVRQNDPDLRRVAETLSERRPDGSQVRDALADLDRQGRITTYSARDAAVAAAKDAVLERDAVVITSRRAEAHAINCTIRPQLQAKGLVGTDEITVKVGRHAELLLAIGDRVAFLKNEYRELGIRNGWSGTVTGIDAERREIQIALDPGLVRADRRGNPLSPEPVRTPPDGGYGRLPQDATHVRVDVDRYTTLGYGWALTGHKSQSQTFRETLVLANAEDKMLSRQWGATAFTRASDEMRVILVAEPPRQGEKSRELEGPHYPPMSGPGRQEAAVQPPLPLPNARSSGQHDQIVKAVSEAMTRDDKKAMARDLLMERLAQERQRGRAHEAVGDDREPRPAGPHDRSDRRGEGAMKHGETAAARSEGRDLGPGMAR